MTSPRKIVSGGLLACPASYLSAGIVPHRLLMAKGELKGHNHCIPDRVACALDLVQNTFAVCDGSRVGSS